MQMIGLGLAVALALVHAVLPQVNIAAVIPVRRCFSFAGGVSIGFIFLSVLPTLGRSQTRLDQAAIALLQPLENPIYLLALLGLTVFYGIDRLVLTAPRYSRTSQAMNRASQLVFWIHISAYAMLNAIFGYMLLGLSNHNLGQYLLYFVAVALHFLIIDRGLRSHHPILYDRQGRWLLSGALLAGAIAGAVAELSETAIALLWSFLAGSTLLNILKRELPDAQKSCFWSFLAGATLYAGLLWLS
ncbi:hypothetical protein C7293_10830 [filamentous cyanobacterium CCT1]|nr:hypothetical protein C7293_10830 [filamentous cyanobacterium CCT1]PSN80845.1 hypothetical protein C8B47_04525 [filamentous cyanobacterium CCP4]